MPSQSQPPLQGLGGGGAALTFLKLMQPRPLCGPVPPLGFLWVIFLKTDKLLISNFVILNL